MRACMTRRWRCLLAKARNSAFFQAADELDCADIATKIGGYRSMRLRRWFALALVLGLSSLSSHPIQAQESGTKVHALSLGDAPKYGPDFKHLDYVNPDAP